MLPNDQGKDPDSMPSEAERASNRIRKALEAGAASGDGGVLEFEEVRETARRQADALEELERFLDQRLDRHLSSDRKPRTIQDIISQIEEEFRDEG